MMTKKNVSPKLKPVIKDVYEVGDVVSVLPWYELKNKYWELKGKIVNEWWAKIPLKLPYIFFVPEMAETNCRLWVICNKYWTGSETYYNIRFEDKTIDGVRLFTKEMLTKNKYKVTITLSKIGGNKTMQEIIYPLN